MTDEYIAGFFDGEGCVRIAKIRNSYSLHVSLSQKDHTILLAIQKYIGMGTVKAVKSGMCALVLVAKQAEEFLRRIEPHVIGKSTQVQLALEFRNRVKSGNMKKLTEQEHQIRAEMADKMKRLKKFDNPLPFLYNVIHID